MLSVAAGAAGSRTASPGRVTLDSILADPHQPILRASYPSLVTTAAAVAAAGSSGGAHDDSPYGSASAAVVTAAAAAEAVDRYQAASAAAAAAAAAAASQMADHARQRSAPAASAATGGRMHYNSYNAAGDIGSAADDISSIALPSHVDSISSVAELAAALGVAEASAFGSTDRGPAPASPRAGSAGGGYGQGAMAAIGGSSGAQRPGSDGGYGMSAVGGGVPHRPSSGGGASATGSAVLYGAAYGSTAGAAAAAAAAAHSSGGGWPAARSSGGGWAPLPRRSSTDSDALHALQVRLSRRQIVCEW